MARLKAAGAAHSRSTGRLNASKHFNRYKEEEEKAIRAPEIEMNEQLARMLAAFQDLAPASFGYKNACISSEADIPAVVIAVEEITKRIEYTPEDVERFSLLLGGFQNIPMFPQKAGIFLSMLVNHGKEFRSLYTVHTAHLESLKCLGFCNKKRIAVLGDGGEDLGMRQTVLGQITVRGNCGLGAGHFMMGGSVVVDGNAGIYVGRNMTGGEIIIKGDAGDYVGCSSEGGRIIVEGDSGTGVGISAKAGEIVLKGRYGSYCWSSRATIYNRDGKLLTTASPVCQWLKGRQ